ncbi:sensor histidine kinase [Leeia aquatica]|uniref:sensor histidine kinase n=1 Tax=Leeia aquatica TaxID=2725557 RepID=UPI00197D5D14|nr:histidine kinase [Leeia aquatica]
MASIKQNLHPASLPGFDQLGVLLRILTLCNGFALVYALMQSERWRELGGRMSSVAAQLEPPLLCTLLLLSLLHRWLRRLPYMHGALLVVVISVGSSGLFSLLNHASGFTLQRNVLVSLLGSSAMLGYFLLRQQALSPAVSEARLQALQARIRPHFLFNSLNAVLSLIRPEPKRAERVLENLAELFRVLMADNRQLVPLSREIELAQQYLEIEQVRLGERLRLDWHIDRMPADALIPPLVLQPLLENAVYHGIEQSIRPGTITINAYSRRHEVFVVIRNPYNGQGTHHAGNKMALSNIKERLLLHFDVDAELSTNVGNDYYQVMIRMPYQRGPQ